MSLTASMWTGVSGLLGHGEKMNVLGNNIANVNTVGFRGQRMDFADFMYANSYSAAGITQIGRGVSIGAVMGDFSQGAFETTTDATDLAIGGKGFFQVKPIGTEEAYYTRAGNFRFNPDGYLTDPNGYALQGWRIDNTAGPNVASGGAMPSAGNNKVQGSGVPTDVRLDTWTVQPKQTTKVSNIVNLAADGPDKARYSDNPFASLVNVWNGTQPPQNGKPSIPDDAFSYQTSVKVYDEAGVMHTLTVYYDKVTPESYDGTDGESVWEYMVTMNPAEDKRKFWDESQNGGTGGFVNASNTKLAGLLMSGTMTFSSGGEMINQSAYTVGGNLPYEKDVNGAPIPGGNYVADAEGNLIPKIGNGNTTDGILQSLYPASVSQSGFPMFVGNFTGMPGANSTRAVDGDKYLIELDLGVKISNFSNPWGQPDNKSLYSVNKKQGTDFVLNPDYKTNGTGGPEYVIPNPISGLTGATADISTKTWPEGTLFDAALGTITLPNGAVITNVTYAAGVPTSVDMTAGNNANIGTWKHLATDPADMNTAFAAPADFAKLQAADLPNQSDLANITPPILKQPNSSTNYAGSYTTKYQSQNGYGYGDLSSYYVDSEGILYGSYSNGVSMPLYQIVLFDFTCKQGLRREGMNLYSQTRDSGDPQSGPPATSGMGKIHSNSLEQSNVDLSREFVLMITTQRGFQSNSKVITTTDTMLETVVNMKR